MWREEERKKVEGGREIESGGRKRNRKWREEEIKKVEGGREKQSVGIGRKRKKETQEDSILK